MDREIPSGRLELKLHQISGKTEVTSARFNGLLRASRAVYRDHLSIPELQLIHLGPGCLDGDRYEQSIHLAEGAQAVIRYQSASKILPGSAGIVQKVNILLEKQSRLALYPNVWIPFPHSRFANQTRVELHKGAQCIVSDVIGGGWEDEQTPFQYRQISSSFQVSLEEKLIVWDQMKIEDDGTNAKFSLGNREWASLGTMYVFGIDEDWTECFLKEEYLAWIHDKESELEVGISKLLHAGVVMRVLGRSANAIQRFIDQCTRRICYLNGFVEEETI